MDFTNPNTIAHMALCPSSPAKDEVLRMKDILHSSTFPLKFLKSKWPRVIYSL